ncbi:hypothetical protein AB4Z48_00155 [Cupriavidus sp. 2TAF22]|uniref:hypothetical protein n=1 Tax=unclassified Cupriavidus TaxID=2640874 RepID=UPI003F8F4EC2
MGTISESASLSIHRAWTALGEAAAETPRRHRSTGDANPAASVVEDFLSQDRMLPAHARAAIEQLLQRQRSLEGELSRQRSLLQEWILSQLTYKTLYYRYSGQSPDAPRSELLREKDLVRRRIRDQLQAGGEHAAILGEQSRSLSKP